MKITSKSLADGQPITPEFAFCEIDPKEHIRMSSNRNPHLAWSGAPAGTRSYALICHDPDVPSIGDDVNQEGRRVSRDLPRVDFFHWVLVDIPATVDTIEAGVHSDGITARGKAPGAAACGVQGLNDYTAWFAGDTDMEGAYGGYDGPCPPWNDEVLHHYHFTVFALDVDRLGLESEFGGKDARAAMESHVLAEATIVGTYSLNPALGS